MTTKPETIVRVLQLIGAQLPPDAEVDGQALIDALGLTSMQQLAFLKSVNEEFGLNITVDDIEAAEGKGGLLSLIPD